MIEPSEYPLANPRVGAHAAQPKAVYRRQPHPLARGGLGGGQQCLTAARLAGFGSAQLHHGTWIRFGAKIMIEAHDAVHLGPRKVQRLGNRRFGAGIDATEGSLDVMQYGQQGRFAGAVSIQYLSQWRGPRHGLSFSACQATCSAMKVETKK